jgi:small subunit ribosomal protein S6
MFILDSNAYARNPGSVADAIAKMVTDAGGEVFANRLWNEQKLAYPIKGRYKGAYWLTYCRLAGKQMTAFNRACQLNETILRHLIVRIDDRLFPHLVSVAKGHVPGAPPTRAEAKEPAGDGEEAANMREPAGARA